MSHGELENLRTPRTDLNLQKVMFNADGSSRLGSLHSAWSSFCAIAQPSGSNLKKTSYVPERLKGVTGGIVCQPDGNQLAALFL